MAEEERKRLDAEAREAMAARSAEVEADAQAAQEPGAWKWAIRKRIWDHLESSGLAAAPRPVHHRIPNFVGSEQTAAQVAALPEFQRARWVKINPDTPQKEVRALTLRKGKMLLVPQPRLRTGFFSILNPAKIEPGKISFAVTQQGVATYGEPIGLDAEITVDLVVIGSVAVNPANGARLGKGEGFAELEYGMLRLMGAINDETPVGIYWEVLSPQKLAVIGVLRELKTKIERESGAVLPTGASHPLPPRAVRGAPQAKGGSPKGGKSSGKAASQDRAAERPKRRWVPKAQ